MLRPVRMCKLDCIIPDDHKVELIEALHKEGIAQVELLSDSAIEERGLERDRPLERVEEVSMLLIRIHKIIDQLKIFDVKQASLLEDFLEIDKRSKIKVDRLSYLEVVSKGRQLLDELEEKMQKYEADKANADEQVSRLTEEFRKYNKLAGLNVDISSLSASRYLSYKLGSIAMHRVDAAKLVESEFEGVAFINSPAGEEHSFVLVAPIEHEKDVEKFVKDAGAEIIEVDGKGSPKEILKKLNKDLEIARKDQEEAMKNIESIYVKEYSKLLAMEELLVFEKDRCEIFYSCGRTQKTTLLRLWTPNSKADRVESIIDAVCKGEVIMQKDDAPEDAPVLLDNPKLLKPFESLVHLFGTPRYNELNPTIFILITFSLFFGIMLTDAVYGVALIALGIFIKKKYDAYSDMANMAFTILLFCGLFAILFGILTGSYLGNFVANALGIESQELALWMDPLYKANAIIFLVAVCAIGFVHLMLGFFLGAYDNFQKGKIKDAMTEYGSWFVLIAGGALAAAAMFPAESPMLPEIFTYVGAATVLIGLVLQFMAKGGMMFLDMIGLVGNTLSYARLLAMALTTAGIALSFNVLAELSSAIPIIGIFVAIVVFFAGHVINILLNSLGAFIHSLRLQYVEWFGTFYEGGGLAFNPFKENRKHTILRK